MSVSGSPSLAEEKRRPSLERWRPGWPLRERDVVVRLVRARPDCGARRGGGRLRPRRDALVRLATLVGRGHLVCRLAFSPKLVDLGAQPLELGADLGRRARRLGAL